MVSDFGHEFVLNIEELCFASDHGKDEKDVSPRIDERSQPVVVLVSGSIEKLKVVCIVINPKRV
jgi:hypothetical protein